jgi:hypothetical protein
MLGITDTVTATISLLGIEIIALKKLSLVSHALAEKIGGSAGEEQKVLATVLDDTIRKIELAAAKAAATKRRPEEEHAQC